jgi:hypothetical protein
MVIVSTKIPLYLVVSITKSNQHVDNHLTGNGKNHRKIRYKHLLKVIAASFPFKSNISKISLKTKASYLA